MLHTVLDSIQNLRARRCLTGSRYRDQLGDLPPGLAAYWAASASREFPGIPRDALFFARASEALMEFFDCVAGAGKPCALPSKAADSVWHAWLRYSPMTLQQFCMKHCKRLIPHVEAAAMPGRMDDALANCLVAARRLNGLPAASATVPRVFSADHRLRMPHGYAYRVVGNRIGVSDMDAHGRRHAHESFPGRFMPAALLSSGLIVDSEVPPERTGGASSCNGGAGGGGDSCDASSCGSSCGGGCGGGGGD